MVYAMLDDQSNYSLAAPSLLDAFTLDGPEYKYTLTSFARSVMLTGRRVEGLVVESFDGKQSFNLPTLSARTYLVTERKYRPTHSGTIFTPSRYQE